MTALDLASAHFAKASHSRRCEEAQRAVCEGSVLLAELARRGAEREKLDETLELTSEAFREQLRLVIEAADIDRRIQEAERG